MQRTSTLLTVFAVLVLPFLGAVFVVRNHKVDFHREYLWLLAAGLILIVAILAGLYLKDRRHWGILRSEFMYLIHHGKYALLIGSAIGFTATAIYLLMPFDFRQNKEAQDAERAASALSLYFGVVGAAIGIHTLYMKTAPITEMHELLDMISDDLRRHKRYGEAVLMVYPALNIGYYREVKNHTPRNGGRDSIPEEHPYKRFRQAFLDSCSAIQSGFHVVTYDPETYRQLYTAYASDKKDASEAILVACAEEAAYLFDQVLQNGGEAVGVQCKANLPPHEIVIGPVSYLVSSFGLPKYDQATRSFVLKESGLAQLLVYRRDDANFAGLVREEVRKAVEEGKTGEQYVAYSKGNRQPDTTEQTGGAHGTKST